MASVWLQGDRLVNSPLPGLFGNNVNGTIHARGRPGVGYRFVNVPQSRSEES
jgi:hypothetical protein